MASPIWQEAILYKSVSILQDWTKHKYDLSNYLSHFYYVYKARIYYM